MRWRASSPSPHSQEAAGGTRSWCAGGDSGHLELPESGVDPVGRLRGLGRRPRSFGLAVVAFLRRLGGDPELEEAAWSLGLEPVRGVPGDVLGLDDVELEGVALPVGLVWEGEVVEGPGEDEERAGSDGVRRVAAVREVGRVDVRALPGDVGVPLPFARVEEVRVEVVRVEAGRRVDEVPGQETGETFPTF